MTDEMEKRTHPPEGPPRRKIRNFLLDPKFQMKYVSMVISVTVVVAGVLGYFAYQYSKGQTQLLYMNELESQEDLSPEFVAFIENEAKKADRRVLVGICGGILCLVLALGITGIVVTHRMVGPAYRIKALLREVRDGHLIVRGGIRRGDELQDVFLAFEEMVTSLRAAQEDEIKQLDAALARAKEAGVPDDAIKSVSEVRDRMQETLEY